MNRAKELAYFAWSLFWAFLLPYHMLNAQIVYYSCGVLHEHGRQCITPMNPYTLEAHPDDTSKYVVQADSVDWGARMVSNEPTFKRYGWVTDSIKWVPVDTTFEGDSKCWHDWVYSEPEMQGNRFGAYVFDKLSINVVCARGAHFANGRWDESPWHSLDEHCQYEEREREKICRKCLRGVVERERWFQHFVAPPKSEFEILKEKQRVKQ